MASIARRLIPVLLVWAAATPALPQQARHTELEAQVRQAELGFAKSMADRDPKAFAAYLAPDAVFLSGQRVQRGAAAVAAGWQRYFDGTAAPFSWSPETVVVLATGTLALSTGPVLDPSGKRIGTFNSVWRREKSGRWLVVIDKGCPPCNCGQ